MTGSPALPGQVFDQDPAGRQDATDGNISDRQGVPEPAAPATDPAELTRLIRAAVHDELNWLPDHVLAVVKRDRAFDALNDRLRSAERRLETRRERPLIVALHRMLSRLRRLDFDQDVKESLDAEIVQILASAGISEIGQVGEPYDPARHEALQGHTAADGTAAVVEVLAPGLSSFDDVIVRSQVRIAPDADPASAPRDDTRPETVTPGQHEEELS
jgi:hypothetical protein